MIEQIDQGTNTATYLQQDRIGSTRLLTDSAGLVVGTTSFTPYGTVASLTGVASAFGYAGEYTDTTSLIYLRARYYDPQTGQFLSVDPEADLTRAAYAYGGGDPVNVVDPTGETSVRADDGGTGYVNTDTGPSTPRIGPATGPTTAEPSSSGRSWNFPAIARGAVLAAGSTIRQGLEKDASLVGRWLSTSPIAKLRSFAGRNLKGVSRLAKAQWLDDLTPATAVISLAITFQDQRNAGHSLPRALAVAGASTAGGTGGAALGEGACALEAFPTGGVGLVLCPATIIGGAGLGSATGDWFGKKLSNLLGWK